MTIFAGAAFETAIARALGRTVPAQYERTTSGVSGNVYRITRGSSVFYLRLAEQDTHHLDVDAEILRHLSELGVRVPEVIYVEHFDSALQRSFLVMAELPGEPLHLASSAQMAAQVARQAGHDLALFNQIPVEGFGFVRRDTVAWPPAAEFPRYEQFVVSYLPNPWPGRLAQVFTPLELRGLETLVEAECVRPHVASQLVHGDFDVTPVFQLDGRYTGLIDFGEVRGADAYFDLGQFLLHDRESYHVALFEDLYAGYSEVLPTKEGDRSAIIVSGILLGLRQLSRWLEHRGWPPHHHLVRARVQRVRELLQTVDVQESGLGTLG